MTDEALFEAFAQEALEKQRIYEATRQIAYERNIVAENQRKDRAAEVERLALLPTPKDTTP